MADQTYTGVLPGQAAYDSQAATLKAAYEAAQAKITQQRSGIYTQYGIDAQGNPMADNPTGAYQQTAAGAAHDADALQAAQVGGIGGGLAAQQTGGAQAAAGGAFASLAQQFKQATGAADDADVQNTTDYNNGLYQAMLANVQSGIDAGLYNQAGPGDTGDAGGSNDVTDPTSGGTWTAPPPPGVSGGTGGLGNRQVQTRNTQYGKWGANGKWIPNKAHPGARVVYKNGKFVKVR
jgi:hypothetical protein